MRFLLTADWHLRPDRPRCRLDTDWLDTQRQAIRFIVDLTRERDLALVVLGDVFNVPQAGSAVEVMAMQELKRAPRVCLVAGNHDLRFHNYDNVDQSSFGVLRQYFPEMENTLGMVTVDSAPFGRDKPTGAKYAFTHQLVFPDRKSMPFGCEAKTAEDIGEQFPDAQWIFTGDMHHSFDTKTDDGRQRIVNPGCILRQTADLLDYQPKVAIVDTDAGTVEWVPVPDNDAQVVTDAYLRTAEVREERVSAFVEAVKSKGAVSLSFRDNLDAKLPGKRPRVQEIVTTLLEQAKGTTK